MKTAADVHMLPPRNFKTKREAWIHQKPKRSLVAVTRHLAILLQGGVVSIYTYIHTYIRPCMDAYIHMYIHTYIHIYICLPPPLTDHALVTVYSWQVTRLRYCI